jgi:hypothetical protein
VAWSAYCDTTCGGWPGVRSLLLRYCHDLHGDRAGRVQAVQAAGCADQQERPAPGEAVPTTQPVGRDHRSQSTPAVAGEPHKTMHDCAMDASVEASNGVRERYLKQVGAYPSDDEMGVTHESIDLALTMCENYALKYGTPLPPDYTLIKAEQKIRVPVPGYRTSAALNCRGSGYAFPI